MPREYEAARDLCKRIQELRTMDAASWMRADTKTQVTLDPRGYVQRAVIAVQHAPSVDGATDPMNINRRIKAVLMELAVRPILGSRLPTTS